MRSKPSQMLLVVILSVWVAVAARAEDKKDNHAPPALTFSGRVEAAEQAAVQARVAAAVDKVNVDIGDRVKQGQVLIELSAPELRDALDEAEARLAQAKAQVEEAQAAAQGAKVQTVQADAGLDAARAAVKRARAAADQAKDEADRMDKLLQAGANVVSRDEVMERHHQLEAARAAVEEAEAQVKTADAGREVAVAGLAKAQAGVKAAEAGVEVAEVGVRRAQTRLGYTKITAPFDAVVTRRLVDPGATVGPPAPGQAAPLLTIMRDDPVRVAIDVDERSASHIAVGAPVLVNVPSLHDVVKGKVARTAGAFNPDSGTMRVEIDLPNPDGNLRPGMSVTVQLKAGEAGK